MLSATKHLTKVEWCWTRMIQVQIRMCLRCIFWTEVSLPSLRLTGATCIKLPNAFSVTAREPSFDMISNVSSIWAWSKVTLWKTENGSDDNIWVFRCGARNQMLVFVICRHILASSPYACTRGGTSTSYILHQLWQIHFKICDYVYLENEESEIELSSWGFHDEIMLVKIRTWRYWEMMHFPLCQSQTTKFAWRAVTLWICNAELHYWITPSDCSTTAVNWASYVFGCDLTRLLVLSRCIRWWL